MPLPCAHDARASGARCSGTTLATAVLAVAGAVREVVASVMPARYGCASSVVVALGLLLLAPNASGGKPRPEPEASSVEPVRRQLQVARPKSYFVEVSSGTCETNGHVTIEDGPECKQAAELWGFKITWGPNGGYEDVVDGCSIRGKENAFLIPPKGCIKGHTTPEWVPGANGKATCTCTDWQPCMCRAAAASGWGSVFLLTSAIISMGYVGLGLLHGQRQGRESDGAGPAALLAMHPHITQWRSVGGLVADGLAFTVSRGTAKGSRGAGYSPLKATASSGHGHVAAPDSPKHKSKKKKSSGKSEKKQEGAADGAVGSETGGGGAPTVQAPTVPAPASAGTEAAAAGTAAGDGGRWVHVPG